MTCYSTPQVAKMLGIPPGRLSRAVWDGRVRMPAKGPGGAYIWTEGDNQRASWVLRRRSADDLLEAERGTTKETDDPQQGSRSSEPVHIREILPEVMADIEHRCREATNE